MNSHRGTLKNSISPERFDESKRVGNVNFMQQHKRMSMPVTIRDNSK